MATATQSRLLADFLSHLRDAKQDGAQWEAKCPVHPDNHHSLGVKDVGDKLVVRCRAGCATEAVLRALKLDWSALFADKPSKRPEKVWQLRDVNGELVAEHIRRDLADGDKKYSFRRNGVESLNGLPMRSLPLYGAHLLKAWESGSTVVLTEGEKAADAVRSAGLQAVGTACGAAVTPDREVLEPLRRFDVVLWPDADSPGREHMEKIAAVLGDVRWVSWLDAPKRGDAADTTSEHIRELVEQAATTNTDVPEGQAREQTEERGAPQTYSELLGAFRRWLYLPDDMPLRALLATVIGNKFGGDPLWLGLIGPSGSLKTELLNTIMGLPDVYPLDSLTPNTFLSGKEKTDPNASLLKRLPHGALVVMRDFSTVLSMPHEKRAEILSQLRKIYDGHLAKATGDGGDGAYIGWEGKIGFAFGCTLAIEDMRSFTGHLGERFLYFSLDSSDRSLAAKRALGNRERSRAMREELQGEVCRFFSELELPGHVDIADGYEDTLIEVADFVAHARTPVPRDRFTREIKDHPSPEEPTRLAQQLGNLICGHAVLHGRTSVTADDMVMLGSAAMGCIPGRRRKLLDHMYTLNASATTTELATAVDLPTATTRRDLEDFAALRLVQRTTDQGTAHSYKLTEFATKGWSTTDALRWPKCRGCDRQTPKVDTSGLCPDCEGCP